MPSNITPLASRIVGRRRRTSLRLQTLLLVGATLLLLLAGLYVPLRGLLLESFARLEAETMRANGDRAMNAVGFALEKLDSSTTAWAIWDDTYAFIEQPDPAYLEANTNDDAFPLYDLTLMLFVDRAGQVVFGKYYDLEAQRELPIPTSMLAYLGDHPTLFQLDDPAARRLGVVVLPEGPLLLAARPILTSQGAGPPRGAVIFGRALDATKLEELARLTQFPFTVHTLDDALLPADVTAARREPTSADAIIVAPLDERRVASYAAITDPDGAAALIARVVQPRTIYAQGQTVLTFITVGFLVAGLIFGGVISLVLSRLILARLLGLSADVAAVGAQRGLAARVRVDGHDEIADLGQAINAMLDARAQADEARRQAEAESARLQAESLRAHEEQVRLQAEVIRMQRATLAEQAMPIIPVSDAVVVVPLVGALDPTRAEQMLPRLLEQAERQGARVLVLDITGVPVVDTAVAQALLQATRAVRLLGAQVVVTGVSPDMAQALVALNLDLGSLVSERTLQEGIRRAERLRGQGRHAG